MKALILAGERRKRSPLLKEGLPFKALLPVCGKEMFLRVYETLKEVPALDEIYVSAPKELYALLKERFPGLSFRFIPQASSPSTSVFFALEEMGSYPVFLTTADHALLTPEIVSFFLEECLVRQGALGVGVVPFSLVKAAYPSASRTTYRLKEGRFCSANLYFLGSCEVKRALYFWRQVEERRKNPLKIVAAFGPLALLRYLWGRLDLEEAFLLASKVLGCEVFPVSLPFARAAVDVDDEEDLLLAQEILSCKER